MIFDNGTYEEKYSEYHKKLVEKDKFYKSKQFKMNHKSDWR